jgi:NADH dehydrogenase [ubiquinone] 1 alpha subcomplex assembly factor 1
MIYLLLFFLSMAPGEELVLFDFQPEADLSAWRIVDDGVMGGRSEGHFELSEEGHGVFYGDISLENYGGFSSVRFRPGTQEVSDYSTAVIRVKGDGKRYQFRVKSQVSEAQSYIQYFETSGEWETIEIPLADLYPTFRGRQLAMPNYPGQTLSELTFLIANKRAESFRLEVDWVGLR